MLRQLLATCEQITCGRRDRGLLQFAFVETLRRFELGSNSRGYSGAAVKNPCRSASSC
jgi:hypothetical protein